MSADRASHRRDARRGKDDEAVRALVTGGAGFIGSNLVDALVARGDSVRVIDDLFSGFREHVHPEATFFEASIANEDAVREAVEGVDVVFHQAAHRAVLQSVEDPIATDAANVHGTIILLKCALDAGVRRLVNASSSSVYGGAADVPTPESAPTLPRSPYAATKLAAEHYCRVFAELHDIETVTLRYFNVFGPRQRPDSAYAAVIPLFIDALRSGTPPEVHGDGRQSRDFTYVTDVVQANLAAASCDADTCSGGAYNIAGGKPHSLLDLLEALGRILDVRPEPVHTGPRPGDIRHSCADRSAARRDLGFECEVGFDDGLRRTVEWFLG
jgi:UDP-glucose 4-epimerase